MMHAHSNFGRKADPLRSSQSYLVQSSSSSDNTSEDSVSVGTYTFRPCSVDLRFSNVGYAVKIKGKPRHILHNLSGTFEPGKLHCIMGPSGAGKSSLLNVLAGFNTITEGEVIVNGETLPANGCHQLMAAISSYIMQHDFLVAELTICETLEFAAKLKLPNGVSKESRRQLLDDLLKKMALSDVANRRIWKLSGGQRKRVAVAVELINYPPVIFLDEPTSGLDSTSCYRLVELLKTVANVGCNVIATIHQPNSRVFRMFDTLYVLAQGGRLAYSGPPVELTTSLRRIGVTCGVLENPADLLFENGNIAKLAARHSAKMRFLSGYGHEEEADEELDQKTRTRFRLTSFDFDTKSLERAQDRERKATLTREKSLAKLARFSGSELMAYCSRHRATPRAQFGTLLHRTFVQAWRDKVYLLGRFVAYMITTLIFGASFQNVGNEATKVMINTGYLFLITNLPLVGTSIVTILHFPIVFNVLLRESVNSWYSVSAFYLTQGIVDNLIVIVTALVFPNIMWLFSGQAQWSGVAIPMLSLIMCIHAITTHHISYILAIGGNEESLPYLPFTLAMLQTIFSGFMVPINQMPSWIRWIQYVYYGQFTYRATMRTAFGALISAEENSNNNATTKYGGAVKLPCNSPFAAIHPLCAIENGDQVLEDILKIYPTDGSLDIDIIAIGLFCILFFMLGWILLSLRLRSAKKAISRA